MVSDKQISAIRRRRKVAATNARALGRALPYLEHTRAMNEVARINDCCTWWGWDVYHPDKMMVVDRVNRCESRLCPNCLHMRSVEVYNRHAANLEAKLGYTYHVTLTIPNVNGEDLRDSLKALTQGFTRLWRSGKLCGHAMAGALRAIEVSYNHTRKRRGETPFHPHLHCLIVLDKPVPHAEMVRTIHTGTYDFKRKEEVKLSTLEHSLGERWAATMGAPGESYLVRVRLVEDTKGLFEVVKYPAKFDSFGDMSDEDFAAYYLAIRGRRLRQGYGTLYNVADESADMTEVSTTTKGEVVEMLGYEPEGIRLSIDDGFEKYEGYRRFGSYADVTISNIGECFPTEGDGEPPAGNSRVVNITVNM